MNLISHSIVYYTMSYYVFSLILLIYNLYIHSNESYYMFMGFNVKRR